MKFRTLAAAAAALSLTATPVLAADSARLSAPASSQNEAFGSASLLLILALGLMAAGLVMLVDDEDNTPSSP